MPTLHCATHPVQTPSSLQAFPIAVKQIAFSFSLCNGIGIHSKPNYLYCRPASSQQNDFLLPQFVHGVGIHTWVQPLFIAGPPDRSKKIPFSLSLCNGVGIHTWDQSRSLQALLIAVERIAISCQGVTLAGSTNEDDAASSTIAQSTLSRQAKLEASNVEQLPHMLHWWTAGSKRQLSQIKGLGICDPTSQYLAVRFRVVTKSQSVQGQDER